MSTAEQIHSCVRYLDRALSKTRHLLPKSPCARDVVARLGGPAAVRELTARFRPATVSTPALRWPSVEEVRDECFLHAPAGARVDRPADMHAEAFWNAGKPLAHRGYLAFVPGTKLAFIRTQKAEMPRVEKRTRKPRPNSRHD